MNPLLALALAYGLSEALIERFRADPADADLIGELERELDRLGANAIRGVVTMQWDTTFNPLCISEVIDREERLTCQGGTRGVLVAIGRHPHDRNLLMVALRTRDPEGWVPLLEDDEVVLWDFDWEDYPTSDTADLANYFRMLREKGDELIAAWVDGDAEALHAISWAIVENAYEEAAFADDTSEAIPRWVTHPDQYRVEDWLPTLADVVDRDRAQPPTLEEAALLLSEENTPAEPWWHTRDQVWQMMTEFYHFGDEWL